MTWHGRTTASGTAPINWTSSKARERSAAALTSGANAREIWSSMNGIKMATTTTTTVRVWMIITWGAVAVAAGVGVWMVKKTPAPPHITTRPLSPTRPVRLDLYFYKLTSNAAGGKITTR